MNEYRDDEHRKHRVWKYIGIICATLLGAFLAFYVVVDCTMKRMTSPEHYMREAARMNKMAMQNIKEFDKDVAQMTRVEEKFLHKNTIKLIRTPDSYKFIIDLKPFKGNQNAINLDVNGSMLTISGECTTDKRNSEIVTNLSETYDLGKDADFDKMSKKKEGDKLIVNIPIDKD